MAVISQIKATSDNVDYNIRDDYSIWGGRNLLLNTKDYYGWYTNNTTLVTFNEHLINFSGNTSKSWICIGSPCLDYERDIKGKDITLSMEVRSNDYTSLPEAGYPSIQFYLKSQGPQATNYSTRMKGTPANVITPISDEWTKFSVTLENITDSTFTNSYGDTAAPWFAVNLWLYQTKSVQFRKLKLEIGNKPTDWSPAPEDIARFIGNETIELYSE